MKTFAENNKQALFALVFIAWITVGGLIGRFLPGGIDWQLTFRPAARALLAGHSPYADPSMLSPYAGAPWGLIPLMPLAIFPEHVGQGMLFFLSLAAFAYTAYKLGAKPVTIGIFLASPPIMHSLLNANLEFMVLFGFILPPQIGLFFLMVKPQIGSAVAVFWLVEAWRKGGWREVVRVFAPATVILALSFLIFGLWPLNATQVFTESVERNASLWPMSIPVGLVLLFKSLRDRNKNLSMAAAPFLSPYVLFHAWSGALISLANSTMDMLAAVIGLWILVIIRSAEMFG